MAEKSGKQLKEDLLAAREYASDLGKVLQNDVAGAAKSTQERAQKIADSLKGQVDTVDKLAALYVYTEQEDKSVTRPLGEWPKLEDY